MSDNLQVSSSPNQPEDLPRKARRFAMNYANAHFEKTDGTQITLNDTYVVWFAFVLGGWKALVSTVLPDGKYYEVTYNKEKSATYVDCYVKLDNVEYKDE